MSTPWYATWFNTEFYHDLYRHRDEHEARLFIVELCKKLGVQDGERAMDMACGREADMPRCCRNKDYIP